MAEDKSVQEAVNSLAAMFTDVDKEMITDIYLFCKKDIEKTVDQLIGMGLGQEKQKKPSPPIPKPTQQTQPIQQKHTPMPSQTTQQQQQPTLTPTPTPQPVSLSTSSLFSSSLLLANDDVAEKRRLEHLNQQLAQEYQRLAQAQTNNVQLMEQLTALKESIAVDSLRVEEERQELEDQKLLFQRDKKRLEEHLEARMKDQMRKNEDEMREREEQMREEEQEKLEEERVLKLARREEKALEKQEKEKTKAAKLKERQVAQQLAINQIKSYYESTIDDLKEQNEKLRVEMEEMESACIVNEQSSRENFVDTLRTVITWLNKSVGDITRPATPDTIREELLRALQQNL